ncbi:FadR family transcriptional regulator [Actinosynnema pretiosum subsp. pretiosum]|uniref:FadR family transcriptional regulator n=1 Tax=Actinosynnema pretiosum subsp. pretiosum TaxID=103721 RepID=A0AA45LAJ6_9PSEU|nr:Transcriptional regulator, GntR family [Actinosynnema pretiosum subsp. pretiosum]QUF05788.1 FadR family transcriptional regulator [Actinosynnema pretiosum subsp. pretiosum]
MPAFSKDPITGLPEAIGDVHTGGSLAAGVAQALLAHFTQGGVSAGERLPPERALASALGVGRSAVREALAALELLGVVVVKPGSGTYLRGDASELLPKTLSWGLMLGEPQTQELIEVRHGLETYAVRLAASRVGDEELARLGGYVDTMRASVDDLERFVEADMMFHMDIGHIAGNEVLHHLLQSIRSLIRVWVERGLRDRPHAELSIQEHSRVLEALRARDPQAAAEAMAAHMTTAGLRLSSSLPSRGARAGDA